MSDDRGAQRLLIALDAARPATTPPSAATIRLAVDKAEATGDLRMAALARVHIGRVLRALGETDGARAAL
jgi:hypothetical protein